MALRSTAKTAAAHDEGAGSVRASPVWPYVMLAGGLIWIVSYVAARWGGVEGAFPIGHGSASLFVGVSFPFVADRRRRPGMPVWSIRAVSILVPAGLLAYVLFGVQLAAFLGLGVTDQAIGLRIAAVLVGLGLVAAAMLWYRAVETHHEVGHSVGLTHHSSGSWGCMINGAVTTATTNYVLHHRTHINEYVNCLLCPQFAPAEES